MLTTPRTNSDSLIKIVFVKRPNKIQKQRQCESINTASPWRWRHGCHWTGGWSVRSPGSAQSPSVYTSGDTSPSVPQLDPCGPPGGHCGLPAPRFLAGSIQGGPVEWQERETEKWWDNDESWNWLDWLTERQTEQESARRLIQEKYKGWLI